MPVHSAICSFCPQPAVDPCPRCRRSRCAQHRPRAGDNTWPRVGYKIPDLCPDCVRADERHARKAGRVAVAASAAVIGMALSAFAVLFLGGALGFGAELTVLCMLIAELGVGGLSAYVADRRVQSWLLRRDQKLLQTSLPEARLLQR